MKRLALPSALLLVTLMAASAEAVPALPPLGAEAQPAATHVIKTGDSLYSIARRYGLTVKDLQRLNGLKGDALKPGKVLRLRESSDRQPPAAAGIAPAPATIYLVKKGDSLYAIARRKGLSVAALKQLNGLKNDALKPGQRLIIGPAAVRSAPPAIVAGPDAAALLRQEAAAPVRRQQQPSAAGAAADSLEEVAYTYLATPYRFGGSSRQGIDCSSFVQNVFRQLNVELPRTAREQYRLGDQVDQADLQSGDLLFFRTYAKYPSHVGIYLGDQRMIHASPRSRRVVISNMNTPYFRNRFIGAKRLALREIPLNMEELTRDVTEEPEADIEEDVEPGASDSGI